MPPLCLFCLRCYLDAVTYPGYGGPAPTQNAPATPTTPAYTGGCWNVSGPDSVRFQTTDNSGNIVPAYNQSGQVTQRIDGKGAVTQYQYNDAENQLTGIIYGTSNALNVALTYDPNYGRLTSETDTEGTYTWTYDDLSLPQTATTQYTGLPVWTLAYGYNPDGSRATTTVSKTGSSYAFTYGYDAVGRPNTLTNTAQQTFTWNYLADANGNSNSWLASQKAANYNNATLYAASYSYDGRGRVTDLANRSGAGGVLSEFGSASVPMTYDGAGNRTGMSVSMPAAPASYSTPVNTPITYAYDGGATDKRGQLTSESNGRVTGGGGTFTYDNAGNPTTFRSASQPSPTVDNQPGGNTYDGNGSPTTYGGNTLTYDAERRLTSITTASVNLTAGYRADGLRAWKTPTLVVTSDAARRSGSAKTANAGLLTSQIYFLYDGGAVIAELNNGGYATALNTWGATGLLARQTIGTGASSLYTYDPSGNVAQRLDGGGTIKGSYAFDGFGKGVSNDASPTPYQYGAQWGYYTDSETGLLLCGHRHYDRANGRWLTRDPIGYAGGINLYGYAGNNAGNAVDPSGLQALPLPTFPLPPAAPAGPVLILVEGGEGVAAGAAGVAAAPAVGVIAVGTAGAIADHYVGQGIADALFPLPQSDADIPDEPDDDCELRLRHYTGVSSSKKIMSSMTIIASDQNRVFTVLADNKRFAPRDFERKYGVAPGRGNAYVDFCAKVSEVEQRINPDYGTREYVLHGNVSLVRRKPTRHNNF